MEIQSEAILLNMRPHGESAVVATLFSPEHGKLRGFVRGGRKKLADFQPGNILSITSKKRVETQLGTLTAEVLHMPMVACFDDRLRMQMLNYVLEILDLTMEEEDPHPQFYAISRAFLMGFSDEHLWERLAIFEEELLDRIGYGLSLSEEMAVECPENSPLMYVSPKTGRAVPEVVGAPYHDKLFRLPHFFGGKMPKDGSKAADFLDVFALTGHFLALGVSRPVQSRDKLIQMGIDLGFNSRSN